MKKTIILIFFSYALHAVPPIFSDIAQVQKYAQEIDEYPPIDNTTWANPDYTSYLRKKVPSFWQEVRYKIGLQSWPLWNVQGFKDLLDDIVKKRENDGYIGRFVLKMKPLTGSTFIIWGDVQGAFHSMVRVLTELNDRGIINERFEIVRPYIYFIFNGDFVNRSAYSMEALTLVMRLMERNPEKVFYIRGNHEDNDHWRNFNLKRDLILRATSVSDDEIPLGKEVSRFFNTLPLALYLIGQETKDSIDLVRISHFPRSSSELDETNFSGFFDGPNDQRIQIFKLNNKINDSEKKINIRAIIKGESRSTVYRPTSGLSQLEADKGATSWTLLSAPTESYRYLQDFYFDAFGVLDVGKKLNDWTISLYNQDVRELLGFKKIAVYNLVTGLREFTAEKSSAEVDKFVVLQKDMQKIKQEITSLEESCPLAADGQLQGKTKKEVKANEKVESTEQDKLIFGSTLALSGPIKEIGEHVDVAMRSFIEKVNKAGGIDNKLIQLVVLNDAYNPEKARENIEILLNQYNASTVLIPTGTPTLKAYLDLVEKDNVLVLFPISGSMVFRKPELSHIINLRASDSDTAIAVARYMIDTLKLKKFAVVYQDDDYGKGGLQSVQEVFKQKNITDYVSVSYKPTISEAKETAEQIKKKDPEAIIFISTPIMAKNIIKELEVDFFRGRYLAGTSDMGETSFQDFIKEKGLSFIVGHVLPSVESSLSIATEFKEFAKEQNIKLDPFAFEAYIGTKLLIARLKEIKGSITKESIIKQFEKIKDVDFQGLPLRFDAQTRQLLHTIWLNTGSGDWVTIHLDEKE